MKRLFCLLVIVQSLALAPRKGFGQWLQTNGPYGASVLSITHLGNDIFIGAVGGIFESTDGGSSWQPRSNGLPEDFPIYALTTHGPNIFAGVYPTGVYRSTDSGASWSSASSGLPDPIYIYLLSSSKQAVFLLGYSYSYVTTNDGNDWQLLDTNLTKISVPQTALTVDSTTYFAGSWITATTDNGLNWIVTAIPPSDTSWDILCMANIGDILFANDRELGVLRSTNNGTTWDYATSGLPSQAVIYLATIGDELFAGSLGGSVYRSIDSGNSWQLASSGLPIVGDISDLESDGTELLTEFSGLGMYRSFDSGKNWSVCNHGFIAPSVNSIVPNDTIVASTTYSGLFFSIDNGESWQPFENNLSAYQIDAIQLEGDNLYAGWTEGLLLSTDWGTNWQPISEVSDHNVYSIQKSGSNLVVGTDDYLYVSIDNGASWEHRSQIAAFWLSSIGPYMFAGNNYGIYVSTDYGYEWQSTIEGLPITEQIIASGICTVDSEVFISYTQGGYRNLGVYLTKDFGNTWHQVADTLFPRHGYVTCFASSGSNLFAATDSSGIFITTDNGAHWTSENLGLGDSSVLSLAVQGNELLAGTASSGVWRRPLAEMIAPSSVASERLPSETISVYPDPASSLVTISCPGLKGEIDARLISITGVSVWRKTLNGDGGTFQLDFNGISNGTYQLELRSDEVSQSTKIVIKH